MRSSSHAIAILTTILLAPGCWSGARDEDGGARPGGDRGAGPVADSAPAVGDGGTGAPDSGQPADSGPRPCVPPCGAQQICVDGTCEDLPSQCPCPLESYCDLNTNTCVPGCTGDDHCGAGRYCDAQRQCQNGCREGQCPRNELCNLGPRSCECVAGHHRCAGSCVPEGLNSCGASCAVCPSDPHGTATCTAAGCQLACNSGYKMCGGACAACPQDGATSYVCSGSQCVADKCTAGQHVCDGNCVLEDAASCGPACAACKDATQGACSGSACYEVVDFGYFPKKTTCDARCAALGKSCAAVCDVHYTRPNGTQYNYVAGGLYTQQAAYQPYGFVACDEQPPGTAPTSYRCCCTEELTGTPQPGCTKHTDCGAAEFCWDAKQECYPTTDSRCPPGYTYKGQCSSGTDFCAHSSLPSGTQFVFAADCPAGTTHRGGFYCSDETKVCVPD